MVQRKIVSVVAFGFIATFGAVSASARGSSDQPWAACLKSHETGIYVTPAFRTNTPDYRRAINVDAERRWGSADYVDCDFADTSAEADRLIRNHYTTPVSEWALPWSSAKTADLPKKSPGKGKGSSGGYLVVEDKKSTTTQVATPRATKPAPKGSVGKSVDKGSNNSKCHLEGKRYVCPASKQ